MSANSGSSSENHRANNANNDNAAAASPMPPNSGDYTRINWNPPGMDRDDSVSTKNATLALKTAIAVARAFDANCALRNPAKECTIPMFEPQELILGEPLRSSGFFTDIGLRGIKLTRDLQHGEFSEDEEEFRERFAERSIDGHYAVKFLQKGLYNSVHAASAASDFMMETKILMNLAPHPNICQIYGVTAAGSDAFLSRGKEGFYIILDRLSGTMIQQLQTWREEQHTEITSRQAKGDEDTAIATGQHEKLMQRLEIALDIGSALLFLSDRQIVFHLRPDKVGFDVRYGRIKLCDFGQARENGQLDQAPSLTKTDDIRILAYTAPEVLCQAPVTVAADVYAYGIVLWEMLTLHRPFDGMSRAEHFERVLMNSERPEILPNIPKAVQSLMEKCWDPHLRPTMKKVYDTVEEVLLFQDEKPEMAVLPVIYRPPLQATSSADGEPLPAAKSKPPRQLRRTKTEEGPYPSSKSQEKRSGQRRPARHHQQSNEEGVSMRDRSSQSETRESSGVRVSRKSRTKTSNHESSKDRSRNSNNDSGPMKDDSKGSHGSGTPMKDRSKDSHGSSGGMKDKSKKDRVSRRSRISASKKAAAEETSQSAAKSSAAETETTAAGTEDKREQSLPELFEADEEQKEKEAAYVGDSMKTAASPVHEKAEVKLTQQSPTIPADGETEAETEGEPKKLPGYRSQTSTSASASSKGPVFGRSQTTTSGAGRSRR